MAIVQISRIQHRYGTSENLPQLAIGEVGLAVDTRRVYIGNGGTSAPLTENLELLTSRSDVISVADSYTYSDAQIGYSVQSGASANSPVTRTLQNKLDDVVSVRDFGAVGDGNTDDTAAINRALFELFARENFPRIRRSLFFPAGIYNVTSEIKIPTYAKLVGEGPNSSIIKGISATPSYVARTADSLQQTGSSIGSNSAIAPSFIVCQEMSFETSQDIDIMLLDQAEGCLFDNVAFNGSLTSAPSSVGTAKACVAFNSSAVYTSKHVNFKGCTFKGHSLGVNNDYDSQSILFDGCHFHTLFKGVKIGENVTGSAPKEIGPKSFKVTGSMFNNIYSVGFDFYNGKGAVSAFNHYGDVANQALGAGNATTHVINLQVASGYSIGDNFDRPNSDITTARYRVNTNNKSSFGMDSDGSVLFGNYIRRSGSSAALANNTTASTGLTFPSNGGEYAVEISYLITRNSKYRQGVLTITHDGTAQVVDDEFSENNGDVGVTFALANTSNITTLNYTTDSGTTGTFAYSVRIIR